MDFLEDLFDFGGDRKRGRGKGGRDDHDDHDDRDHDRRGSKEDLTCTKCSKPVISGAKFCPNCGAEISAQAFCVKCGIKLMQGSAFCQECGTKTK
jgi:membrane protease subunit (stomatin/prohibitin family)